VAAVREAVLHGRPGIAVSQYRRRGVEIDWQRSVRWVAPLLTEILGQPAEPGVFWNINLPHLDPDAPDPPAVICPVDPSPLALSFKQEGESWHYNGDYHNRPRQPGTDVDVCFNGRIAVSRVALW
jgi:5'-nucleotidase